MSENAHPRADAMDGLSTRELIELMHGEDRTAIESVHSALDQIADAVDRIAARLRSGGRLHYFGAGTSGRLASLDAAECPATFGVDADLVQPHAAGDGEAEDDHGRGVRDAGRAGALVVGLSCAPGTPLGAAADIAIEVDVGPEVIAGSTRLKAGTAQKVALNMISTGVFKRLGHTYRGRMVDVVAANDKLRRRAARMVRELTGRSVQEVDAALRDAGGSAKVAILMLRFGIDATDSRARLFTASGDLAVALGERSRP